MCEPIVKRRVWDAVKAMRVPSGRTAKSERLLARLGVLRCASCGGRMVAGGAWVKYTAASGDVRRTRYAFYKCGRALTRLPEALRDLGRKLEALRDRAREGHLRRRQASRLAAHKAREAATRAEADGGARLEPASAA